MSAAKRTSMLWHISQPSHGTFLNYGSYCVTRLDSRDPRALFDLVRYHEDGDYAEHLDAKARAATDVNVSALEALCSTANAALKAAKGEA